MPKALITGITGQDGAYLSRLLLSKGYDVLGLTRGYGNSGLQNLKYLEIDRDIEIFECDLLDLSNLIRIISDIKPDEIYNLSAQSSVGSSFSQPVGTFNYNTISVLNLLEAIKISKSDIKFYQASSSEMYGRVKNLPITELTPMHPMSPYAISKASAHWLTINYREAYGLFACCGILFNHESYLRSNNFFVKKVIRESLEIKHGEKNELRVGNIEIKRDFGWSPKYVEAMHLMLKQGMPDDYIICSGVSVSLKEIVCWIFGRLEIDLDRLIVDEKLYRPTEIFDIYGVNNKAKSMLKWDYSMSFFDVLEHLLEEEDRNYFDKPKAVAF